LQQAAVTVCPRSEGSGFPMKLLNYMAEGRRSSPRPGPRRARRRAHCARRPDGDADAFADAVVGSAPRRALRRRLGLAARASVEDHALWENVLDRIEAVYHRVVAGRGRRPVPAPAEGVQS
jgi:glycosyltransferase involved in cell wall biosynthesis